MSFDFLPNSRWLCLSSENSGFDWFEKSQNIDHQLESLGLDLVQEDIYLFFNQNPLYSTNSNSECLIGRSVVGPKRELNFPFKMIDWPTRSVIREEIHGQTMEDCLYSAKEKSETLKIQGKKPQESFIIRIRRQLVSDLTVTIEAIFYE